VLVSSQLGRGSEPRPPPRARLSVGRAGVEPANRVS